MVRAPLRLEKPDCLIAEVLDHLIRGDTVGPWLRSGRGELGLQPGFDDLLGLLAVLVQFPVPGRGKARGTGSFTVFSSPLPPSFYPSPLLAGLHIVDRLLRDPGRRLTGFLFSGYSHSDEQRKPASLIVVQPVFCGTVHFFLLQSSSTYCLTTVVLHSVHGLPLRAPRTQKKCRIRPGRIRAA